MGTRSTYRFRETYEDKEGKKQYTDLCLVYFQYDGYPSGHPLDTAKWLASGKVVNGISLSEDKKMIFNGGGCLAAQFIAANKDGAGGVYINSLESRGQSWEDYTYDIVVDDGKIIFIAYDVPWSNDGTVEPIKLWEGNPKDFEKFVKKYEESET